MPYYAAERLDTGIIPTPVGVASRNQRYTVAPAGFPRHRRGFNKPIGGCGCGLGAADTADPVAFGGLSSIAIMLGLAALVYFVVLPPK